MKTSWILKLRMAKSSYVQPLRVGFWKARLTNLEKERLKKVTQGKRTWVIKEDGRLPFHL